MYNLRCRLIILVCELLHEVIRNRGELGLKIIAEALEALQEVVEMAMTTLMEISNYYAIHVKYIALMNKNIRLICLLIEIRNLNSWL